MGLSAHTTGYKIKLYNGDQNYSQAAIEPGATYLIDVQRRTRAFYVYIMVGFCAISSALHHSFEGCKGESGCTFALGGLIANEDISRRLCLKMRFVWQNTQASISVLADMKVKSREHVCKPIAKARLPAGPTYLPTSPHGCSGVLHRRSEHQGLPFL